MSSSATAPSISAQAFTNIHGTTTAPSLEGSDVLETRIVQLAWKVTGLKQLFDSTAGEVKSKCVKSPLFDNSRWQIFLYPNSGGHEQYVSLYLSAEPTAYEKERGAAESALFEFPKAGKEKDKEKEKDKAPWRRDGKYKFTFEAAAPNSRLTFKKMEAENHTFSSKERNWGYQSFWRRSEAYYNNVTSRTTDTFLIVCTITSSPTLPANQTVPHLSIPKALVNSFASLFNDPEYCDVVFKVRPEDEHGRRKGREKRLYAAKKILAGRSEYFESMFNSGFNESTARMPSSPDRNTSQFDELNDHDSELDFSSGEDDVDEGVDEDDDSDVDESEQEEDEKDSLRQPQTSVSITPRRNKTPFSISSDSATISTPPSLPRAVAGDPQTPRSRTSSATISNDGDHPEDSVSPITEDSANVSAGEISDAQDDKHQSSTPPQSPSKFRSAPSSPAHSGFPLSMSQLPIKADKEKIRKTKRSSRPRSEVVVADASYSTFRALLYYLYTNQVSFTPLASTFYAAKDRAVGLNAVFPYESRRAFILAHSRRDLATSSTGPASAKALYRLADKMGLVELKQLAFDHIISSLTPENVVYEAFGSFSLRFEEVKRVQVDYLLRHWNEVKSSGSMAKVFGFLRTGRFPGFEEVWLSLLEHLEYNPRSQCDENTQEVVD